MLEYLNDDSSSNVYGRYVALAQVGDDKLYPLLVKTYQEGGYDYADVYALLTSADGRTSTPDAATLYAYPALRGELPETVEDSIQYAVENIRANGSCTFDEAQAMWAANGTPKEIVYAE